MICIGKRKCTSEKCLLRPIRSLLERHAFSFLKYCGISEKKAFSISRQINFASPNRAENRPLSFDSRVTFIECMQTSCNTTNFFQNSSLSKKAQLQKNWINLIIWRLEKAECSPSDVEFDSL